LPIWVGGFWSCHKEADVRAVTQRAIASHRFGAIDKLHALASVPIPVDLSVTALWGALGLTLAALLCSLGFGSEVGELLARLG
jgi:hypothetical protein